MERFTGFIALLLTGILLTDAQDCGDRSPGFEPEEGFTVLFDGTSLEQWTGKKTIDGKDHPGLGNKRGHIGFLGHGHELWFRNISIKEL